MITVRIGGNELPLEDVLENPGRHSRQLERAKTTHRAGGPGRRSVRRHGPHRPRRWLVSEWMLQYVRGAAELFRQGRRVHHPPSPPVGQSTKVAMQQFDNDQSEYPEPETVLAICGAIATGRYGGPMRPDGHWLNEFWQIGRALCDHSEMLQGFQGMARRGLLSTSTRYLAINEPVFEQPDERS
ncbi:unnamed protein product [marine sediment metagenome]|uniref:Uncharacterized protein n=1 Tax=marine sediment metagenome TaxID=412755 RepID=X1M9A9_9ZZZZ